MKKNLLLLLLAIQPMAMAMDQSTPNSATGSKKRLFEENDKTTESNTTKKTRTEDSLATIGSSQKPSASTTPSTSHERNIYKCDKCYDKTFKNFNTLKIHIKNKHNGKTYRCTECNDKTFSCNQGLREHINSKHKGIIYQCTTCDHEPFSSKSSLLRHVRTKHEKKTYECKYCTRKPFTSDRGLRLHILKHHRNETSAPISSKNIAKPEANKPHPYTDSSEDDVMSDINNVSDETSDSEKKYICLIGYCPVSSTSRKKILEHIKQHRLHEGTIHQIQDLNHPASTTKLDKSNTNTPNEENPKTSNVKKLRTVITPTATTIRTNDTIYKCTYCDNKQFTAKCNLKIHIDSKHLGKTYACTDCCEKKFAYPEGLRRHKKKNKGETYTCKYCKTRSFNNISSLYYHIKKHKNNINSTTPTTTLETLDGETSSDESSDITETNEFYSTDNQLITIKCNKRCKY